VDSLVDDKVVSQKRIDYLQEYADYLIVALLQEDVADLKTIYRNI
jgi:hypothetical protein